MKVAVIGRTRWLLDAARLVAGRGHAVALVWTCRHEAFTGVGPQDFGAFAAEVGAEFVDTPAIASGNGLARLAAHACHVAISVNWPSLLPRTVLDLFPLGVLNAHAGDLPRFRGNACPNWAILAGEPHVGLCIHRMEPALDAGPVILRERFPLSDATYIGEVYEWLGNRIPVLLADAVDGLGNGALLPRNQSDDPDAGLRAYPRRPEDGRIAWIASTTQILRLVRASSRPFSGAFSTLEGGPKVTIWRAEPERHPGPFLAVPGQVCYRAGEDPVVACGDGVIRLTEVEMEGLAGPAEAKRAIGASLRSRLK